MKKKNRNNKQLSVPVQPVHSRAPIQLLLSCIGIIITTVIVFLPSLQNDFTNWDDDVYVTENADLQAAPARALPKLMTSEYSSNYHPLTMLVYWAEYRMFKLNPASYHAVNLAVHCINALLVCILLYLLTGSSIAGFIAALLFAVHPLRVESVAWIAELKDVLSGMFYLAALIVWNYYVRTTAKKYYGAALILFILAMLAKPMAVSLPVVLLVFDYLMQRPMRKNIWLEKIPFVIIAALGAVVTIIAQHSAGAIQSYPSLSLIYKICVPFYALVFYTVKTLAPFHLCALYSYPVHPEGSMALKMLLSPVVIAVIAVILTVLRAWNRYIIAAIVFYIVTLLPVLQIIPVGAAIVSERYTYLPVLGLIALSATGIAALLKRRHRIGQTVVWVCIAAVVCTLGFASNARCSVWKNTVTLWNDTISKSHDPIAYYNLGAYYLNTVGQFYPAIDNFSAAIARNPELFDAYNNRGVAYMGLNRYDLAIIDFNQSLVKDPHNVKMLNNRATSYMRIGKPDSAFADYNAALRLAPRFVEIYVFRGTAYADVGKFKEAIDDFTQAIYINPECIAAYDRRASCYYEIHRYKEALADLEYIIQNGYQIDPAFVQEVRKHAAGN